MNPPGPYKLLIADPPWPFDDRLPGPGRGAEKHYSTLSLPLLERVEHLASRLAMHEECWSCRCALLPPSHEEPAHCDTCSAFDPSEHDPTPYMITCRDAAKGSL